MRNMGVLVTYNQMAAEGQIIRKVQIIDVFML